MAVPLLVAKLIESGLGLLGGAVLSKGKEVIESKLGVDIDSLLATDEGKIRLLEEQNRHKEFLLQHIIENRTLDLKDEEQLDKNTDSARQMQIAALGQEDTFSKRFIYWFSGAWSLASAVYLWAITFLPIPKENIRFADMIAGFVLGTIISTIMNFFLGSSRQSRVKDETLSAIVNSLPNKK